MEIRLRWASARSRATAGCACTARSHEACPRALRAPWGIARKIATRRDHAPGGSVQNTAVLAIVTPELLLPPGRYARGDSHLGAIRALSSEVGRR